MFGAFVVGLIAGAVIAYLVLRRNPHFLTWFKGAP